MNNGHRIVELGRQCHYAKIPHMVIEADLSHQAFRLYCWYKKVCGQTGECWQTLETLAAGCRMRTQSVTDARNELERAGFVDVHKTKAPNGSVTITVSIVDIWEKNNARYDKPKVNGVKLPTGIPTDIPTGILAEIPRGSSADIPTGTTNKNPTKNNPVKNHTTCGGPLGPPARNGFALTEFYDKWAGRLRQVLAEHDADIVNPAPPRRGVRTTTLANVLFRVRTERGASESDIEEMIRWLREAYDDDHTPKIRKAMDLRDNWRRFQEAKQRWEHDRGREGPAGCNGKITDVMAVDEFGKPLHPETRKLARRVREQMESDRVLGFVQQKYVDEWLAGQGLPAGRVTARMVNNT